MVIHFLNLKDEPFKIPFEEKYILVYLGGILVSPFSSKRTDINKLTKQSKRLYPKKANKIEYHHIDPQYMGGNPKGKKVPLVDSYKTLYEQVIAKYGKGSNLEIHHLIEQCFAGKMGMRARDMPSIVLTKDEHRAFTEAWRDLISYDNYNVKLKTSNASKEDILNAAAKVYQNYPELLKTIKEIFK